MTSKTTPAGKVVITRNLEPASPPPPSAGPDREQLLAALRHAIDVLAQTKQNFKCKRLAELRRQLQELVERAGP